MEFEEIYKVIFVKCEEISLRFFLDMPGFKGCERIEIQGKPRPVLQLHNGDFILLVERQEMEADTIVLKTDDCLRDYHLFGKKNILDLTKPRYVDRGLELCFSDPSGNQFVILEERDYTEVWTL